MTESDIPNLSITKITDITASASEINKLQGVTVSTQQINYLGNVTSDVQSQINAKQNTLTAGTGISIDTATNTISSTVNSATWGNITGTLSNQTDLQTALNAKQNTLTFDTAPTLNSTNPVTSGGIYTALETKQNTLGYTAENQANKSSSYTESSTTTYTNTKALVDGLATKQNTLTFDVTPTLDSTNPVTSSGVYTALSLKQNTLVAGTGISIDTATNTISSTVNSATWGNITGTLSNQTDLQTALNAKQNTLTFDTTPTLNSTNPVTSGGIYTALETKADSTTPIVTLASSGTISLSDNSINRINCTGNTTFSLPTIADNTIFHQILVQLTMTTAYTITLGTTYYFNKTSPDLTSAGEYNIIYEYDGTNSVCGSVTKGTAS